MQTHPVVNVSQVKPYRDWLEGQPSHQPGPVHVTEDRDNKWEVGWIIGSWYKNKIKKLEFLVHWKGYDDTDCTWEPKVNLSNAKEALTNFYHANPSAPRAISIPLEDFLLLFRGQSLLQAFTPSKFLLITWKLIFREGVVLWLSMPNIILTDLIISFLFLSYQINT